MSASRELQNLVNLPCIPSALNFAVMGGVILIGVLLDQQLVQYRNRRAAAARPEPLAVAAVSGGGSTAGP